MAQEKPFTNSGSNRQSPTVGDDATLLVGAGIDASVAGPLTIGGTNATSIEMNAPVTLSSVQVGTIQTRTVTVSRADLTNASGEQVFNIGGVLPENSMILAVCVELATRFTGGGATSVLLDIGTSGDPDAIVANSDLFAAAVNGMVSTLPAGIAPFKIFTAAGTQLIATIAADVNVEAIAAGACTITVGFVKIA